MTNEELLIRCRIEELPFLASFILNCLKRDASLFIKLFPDYTPTFISNLENEINDLDSIINPKQYTATISLLTKQIVMANSSIQKSLPILKRYISKAEKNLVTSKAAFQLVKLSRSVNTSDRESTVSTLKDTLDTININENLAALKAVGYTDTFNAQLKADRKTIADNIVARKAKIDERSILVNGNYAKMNSLWNKLTEINKDAKAIFGKTDKSKTNDYTFTKLVALIRNDHSKTQISGQINMPNNQPSTKSTLVLTPVDGGKNIQIKVAANGKFSKKGIRPNTYIATAQSPTFANSESKTILITNNLPVSATFTLAELSP